MSAIFSLLAQFYVAARRSGGLQNGLRALQNASALDEARNRFFADLSHELKTPLAILKCYWEVLAGVREGNRQTALSAIGATTDEMARMVDGFLAAARLDFPAGELHKERVALAGLLEEIHDDCAALADNGGIHLTWACGDAVSILADRGRLREVILNLVSNALKHTDAGGAITLSGKAVREAAAGAGGAEIIVRDTGTGIPPEALPYIFERFYRIRTDGTPGTGLGLHFSKKIVEAHGGTISVQSRPDEGTRFVIFLP